MTTETPTPPVKGAYFAIQRREFSAKLGFERLISFPRRFAHGFDKPGVEPLPLVHRILTGADDAGERVVAGPEACPHAGNRRRRAGRLGELARLEGFRKEFGALLGLELHDLVCNIHVA